MRQIVSLLVVALLGCPSEVPVLPADIESPTLAIRVTRIFDGEKVLPESTVLLRGDRILAVVDEALETVRRLHEAGVAVLAGTDVPNPGTAHGISMHRELELLVRAGLTPMEALAAGTSLPADYFALDDRGRISAGRRADLLLVRGDPTTDILATREIAAIIRSGVLVDREGLGVAIAASVE